MDRQKLLNRFYLHDECFLRYQVDTMACFDLDSVIHHWQGYLPAYFCTAARQLMRQADRVGMFEQAWPKYAVKTRIAQSSTSPVTGSSARHAGSTMRSPSCPSW